jgi:hypothetical protein
VPPAVAAASSAAVNVKEKEDGLEGQISLEFATKLHLRYPFPSPAMEDWILLPQPLLFGVQKRNEGKNKGAASNNKFDEQPQWNLGNLERVWVATGNDDDYGFIMGVTVMSCLIGVLVMLRDISKVSEWDDV